MACKLRPEPDNPFDNLAISFQCEIDGVWHTIGYALHEVLKELHEVLTSQNITAVSIDWVKFAVYW